MLTLSGPVYVVASSQLRCVAFTLVLIQIPCSLFTDLNAGTAVPDQATVWEVAAGTGVSFTVPDDWKAGRIWGRADCDFSTGDDGSTARATGSYIDGLECDASIGTGVPPATLAEWTLSGDGDEDWYDGKFAIPLLPLPSECVRRSADVTCAPF